MPSSASTSLTRTLDIENARFRLKFEELFYIQLNLLRYKGSRAKNTHGFLFSVVGERLNSFYTNNLPLPLPTRRRGSYERYVPILAAAGR